MKRKIKVADHFAGCGGAMTALMRAADAEGVECDVTGINHWDVAIATHRTNYPGHIHYCEAMEVLDPAVACPDLYLDLVMAGPSCTHFSNARGAKPRDAQQRASAWDVHRWCERLNVANVLIENVPEFLSWGDLDAAGRPIKGRLGSEFAKFYGALLKLGYNVEWRILCAADYGDATMRRRLFIQARRGAITWPAPTHYAPEVAALNGGKPWRTAREIIDWTLPSKSIFNRKKEIAEASILRMWAGICRYWPPELQQVIARALRSQRGPIRLDSLPENVGPFLVKYYGGHDAVSLDQPLGTITANYEHYGLVEPFLITYCRSGSSEGQARPRTIEEPIPTLCAQGNHVGVVQPFLIRYHGGEKWDRSQTVDVPLGALDTSNRYGVIQPFLVSYHGNDDAASLNVPLGAIRGRDRYGLVEGATDGLFLDIRLRMLQPHELAAAHSFPESYQFCGNRGEIVKQIGNSWPVNMGAAILREIITDSSQNFRGGMV